MRRKAHLITGSTTVFHPIAGSLTFIRPVEEAVGPLHPLRDMLERNSIDDIVRAIDAGLKVFDTGRILMVCQNSLYIHMDTLKIRTEPLKLTP